MAITYLILNIIVLLVVSVIIGKQVLRKPTKAWYFTVAVLLVLTAIFDNVIVGLGIVGYNLDKILGSYIGIAPIEDFMYAILAVIIIPIVWDRLGIKHAR